MDDGASSSNSAGSVKQCLQVVSSKMIFEEQDYPYELRLYGLDSVWMCYNNHIHINTKNGMPYSQTVSHELPILSKMRNYHLWLLKVCIDFNKPDHVHRGAV